MAGDFESGTNEENNGDMREEGRKTAGGFIWTVSNLGGEESSLARSTRNLLSVSITDDAQAEERVFLPVTLQIDNVGQPDKKCTASK